MVKLSSNPTCVLSDADVITNEQAERIAKVLTKHLPGAGDVTEAGKILGVDANGDVALVEDKTGSTYTAGEGLTLENGQFSVNNPMPGASGASQGDVLTVGANGPEWAAPSGGDTNIIAGDGLTGATASSGDNEYTGTFTNGGSSFNANIGVGAFAALKNQSSIPLEFDFPGSMYFSATGGYAGQSVYIRAQHNGVTITSPAIGVLVESEGSAMLSWSDVSDTSFDLSTWTNYSSSFLDGTSGYIKISFAIPAGGSSYTDARAYYYDSETGYPPIPYTLTLTLDESATVLSVTNPVPAYAYANRSQVVRVNQYGDALEFGGYAVPNGSSSTAGNILMLDDPSHNGFIWANKVNVYPSLYNNAGKVLRVNAGATGVEWANASAGSVVIDLIPSGSTQSDIDALGNAIWTAIQNGSVVYGRTYNTDSKTYNYLAVVNVSDHSSDIGMIVIDLTNAHYSGTVNCCTLRGEYMDDVWSWSLSYNTGTFTTTISTWNPFSNT